MTHEIRRVDPAQFAKMSAWCIGGLFAVICAVMLPIFLLAPFPPTEVGGPPRAFFAVFLILYPLFGAFWGWVMGNIASRIYNFVAARTGGIKLVLELVR